VAENPVVPAVAVGMWTDVGVCDEPADRRGIAHFLEHMMFRGSHHVDSEEHALTIARMGGDCNAFTSPDATVYHETVPPGDLDEVLRLEADRFQRLRLTAEHVEIERRVILEELRVRENQPITRAVMRIREEIGRGHPYALEPLGRRGDIEKMAQEDLELFYRANYRPDRLVIAICGDVTDNVVLELVERHFGAWHPPAAAPGPPVPAYEPASGTLSCRLPLEIPIAARVHRTQPLAQIDKPAIDLLVALLSSGSSSPIREALVRRRRLCIEAGCVNMTGARGGMLVVFGAFMPPGRHRTRHAVMKELTGELATAGPDPVRFARHLKRFRKTRAQDIYSCHRRMMGLGNAEILEGGYGQYEEGLTALADVAPERIRAAAAELLRPENTLELNITPENSSWWTWPAGLLTKLWPR